MQQPIQLNIPEGAMTIDGYGTAGFTVKGRLIASDIIIYKEQLVELEFDGFSGLSTGAFDAVFGLQPKPDLLLFGTGANHRFVAPFIRQHFKEQGIGIETMDTGAACRTYNILLAEGREVAALLLKPS